MGVVGPSIISDTLFTLGYFLVYNPGSTVGLQSVGVSPLIQMQDTLTV